MAPNYEKEDRRKTDFKYDNIMDRLNDNDVKFEKIFGKIEKIEMRAEDSLKRVYTYLESSKSWRTLLMGTTITVLLSIMSAIFFSGKVVKSVEILENNVKEIMQLAHYIKTGGQTR